MMYFELQLLTTIDWNQRLSRYLCSELGGVINEALVNYVKDLYSTTQRFRSEYLLVVLHLLE
jgi:hypothetical protein